MRTAGLIKISETHYECTFDVFHFKITRNLRDNSCHAYCDKTGYGFNRKRISEIRKHIVDLRAVLNQTNYANKENSRTD
jgi:hypothetical protein